MAELPLPVDYVDLLRAFVEASQGALTVTVADFQVSVIGRAALLANKRAAGRPQDPADIAALESED